MLRELEAARGDVDQQKESLSGTVTIGVIPTVAPYVFPQHLSQFSRNFPQAQLAVVEEITPILLERVRAATIDLAVLALPIRGHEFEIFPMLTESRFAAVPKQHHLARRHTLSLKDLRPDPFL